MAITEPLVKVLRLVDGEKLAMGYIYEAMDQAKEQIKAAYKDRVASMGLFGRSLIGDGTINSITLYMQMGIFLTQGISIERILIQIRLGR